MQRLGVGLSCHIERLDVGVAAVVNETRFISVKHCVEAEWKELIEVGFLNLHLKGILCSGVVHIKQVAQPFGIINSASHIALLLCDDFSFVLH